MRFVYTQLCRKSQSSDTKSLNIGKDSDEISDATRRMKGNGASDDTRMWREQEHNHTT